MTSREIRRAFLDFFVERDHRLVPSSPLVIPSDPTLLFANAGMNQFKDVFTGRESRDYRRAASVQKCLRVSGKHNDLEMVGRTPRHHTFFEMLGNFSFGDYFKDEAIALAWELLTERFDLPVDRLWVSVFGGSDEVGADEDAYRIWKDRVGVDPARILRLGEADNFWRMGDTGPCGPCTEIHFDLGPERSSVEGVSDPETDSARFLEIWNLVFMQFDQTDDGLRPLPAPSVDTGMGLERIASVVQGEASNYDTDLFVPLLDRTAELASVRRGRSEGTDFALRVIADHARALCMLVADGVVPANDKRGYVLRRLIRRAIRFGRKIGLERPFLHEVTPVVVDELGPDYPELVAAREAILEVGRREEERFAETLATGLGLIEQSLDRISGEPGGGVLGGEEVFRLYDTFGFPLDMARDLAEERGVRLDEEGFRRALERQRSQAQVSWKGARRAETDPIWSELASTCRTEFEGYARTRLDGARVIALVRDGQRVSALDEGQEGEVVLDATPFYAEAGGQVADTGNLVSPGGRARVLDVRRPAPGVHAHRARVETGSLEVGSLLAAEVDEARRESVRRNHTGTHLLHAALREVVGTHVKQAGSLVAPDRLRFDFSHFASLSERTRADVEALVNEKVLEDLPVEIAEMALDEALASGAMALFGEKYGDRVRVVRIGEFSMELCGGTHCARSGEVGLLKLTQEQGVASGTRRVEALTGEGSLERFRALDGVVHALAARLSVPPEQILDEVERRLARARELERGLEEARVRDVRRRMLETTPRTVAGVAVVSERVDGLEPSEMRTVADALRGKLGSGVVILGRADAGKASLLVAVTADLEGRIHAGKLVRELGRIIGGGGGGRPDLAEAGGSSPERLDEALGEAVTLVERTLESSA